MLVTMKEMLVRASKENYGVAAPNVSSELDARAAMDAAEELNAPIILDVGYRANPDIIFFGHYLADLANQCCVPVAINLDHGGDYANVIAAIRAGFSSVMVDRSTLEYEENVAQVKEVVKVAHAVGVSVEAELGHVGQGSNYAVDGVSALTDPAQALDYIQRTGVDMLAVAVGTAHGAYKGTPKLDFDRLAQIKKITNGFPLVMHGGSGTGDDNLKKSCQLGINKVNLNNDLMKGAFLAVKAAEAEGKMEGNGVYGFWRVAVGGWKARLKELMICFGGEGKAWKGYRSLSGKEMINEEK